jgi:hypothetical protein
MRRTALAICLTLITCCAARAQVVSTSADDVEVTIYRGPAFAQEQDKLFGLGMISEERTIELPGGPVTIQFQGVSDAIVPQTAKLDGLPSQPNEINFDYDLLSPAALIAKSVGAPVRVVRTNRTTGAAEEKHAILRSGPQGVMLDIDGRLEALGCSGMDEKLVFESVPTNLIQQPTLSMPVNAPRGRYKVRLSYLTLGLSWSADYVAKIKPDQTLELLGWVTLTNRLSASFNNAPVKVIAGNVAYLADETIPPGAPAREQSSMCWPVGNFHQPPRNFPKIQEVLLKSEEMLRRASYFEDAAMPLSVTAKLSELGDYKLYSLPERTTVLANQTKQVRMLERSNVRFNRVYIGRYDNYLLNNAIDVAPVSVLRMDNKTNRGLGLPLPAGTIAVMEATKETSVLIGEDTIEDMPVGAQIEIKLGESLGVWAKPRVVTRETISSGAVKRSRLQVEVIAGNDNDAPATLELRHAQLASADVRFVAESKAHTLKDGDPQWSYTLAAGARAVLRYTIEINQ